MAHSTPLKKATPPTDWHPADIQAALKKRGWSLRRLSLACGYSAGSLKAVLGKPWPRAERAIANALGMTPWDIWPSRYDREHTPLSGVRCRQRIYQSINTAVPINGKNRGSS